METIMVFHMICSFSFNQLPQPSKEATESDKTVTLFSLFRGRGGFLFFAALHLQLVSNHQSSEALASVWLFCLLSCKCGWVASFCDLFFVVTFSVFALSFLGRQAPLIQRQNLHVTHLTFSPRCALLSFMSSLNPVSCWLSAIGSSLKRVRNKNFPIYRQKAIRREVTLMTETVQNTHARRAKANELSLNQQFCGATTQHTRQTHWPACTKPHFIDFIRDCWHWTETQLNPNNRRPPSEPMAHLFHRLVLLSLL